MKRIRQNGGQKDGDLSLIYLLWQDRSNIMAEVQLGNRILSVWVMTFLCVHFIQIINDPCRSSVFLFSYVFVFCTVWSLRIEDFYSTHTWPLRIVFPYSKL